MSPEEQARSENVAVTSNIYTVILALAFCAVVITAAFVAYKCYFQYGTIFNIP